MTIKIAESLHPGDQVFWTDPDTGVCDRIITISAIKIVNGVVCLTDVDGSYLECRLGELS